MRGDLHNILDSRLRGNLGGVYESDRQLILGSAR